MKFKNGDSRINREGRPVGSKNEKTKQWELLSDSILNEHCERFNEVLRKLPDKQFIDAYIKIIEFFKPKITRSSFEFGDQSTPVPSIVFFDTGEVKKIESNEQPP